MLGRSSLLSSPRANPPPPPALPAVPGRGPNSVTSPNPAPAPASTAPAGRGDASDARLVAQSLPEVACIGEPGRPATGCTPPPAAP